MDQEEKLPYKISENNIQSDGRDDSDVFIQEIQNTKLNIVKELYEVWGYDLGDNFANVEFRNYSIDNPLVFEDPNESLIDIDLSNYKGEVFSVETLCKIFPHGSKDYIGAALTALDKYGDAVGLNQKGKLMVLAQFGAESGFLYKAELGKGKGRKYGLPAGPYNKIYYGRGPIQITWEQNYKKISKEIFPKMGITADIWKDPDLCERNLIIGCAASLAWFMLPGNGKRAVECANKGDVDGLSKAINGGWNGIDKRREYTKKIFQLIS